jgi:flagellar biosynthesis protein FlhB
MKIKREPPGTRSEHAGEIKNIIGSNDTTNIGFTSVPSKQKSTQKGSLLKSTQKTLLGTLVFVSFVLFLLRLFCNNLFYNTIELVILFPTKIVLHPTQTDTLLPLLHVYQLLTINIQILFQIFFSANIAG